MLTTSLSVPDREYVDNKAIEMCEPTWCEVCVNSVWGLYKRSVPSLLLWSKEINQNVYNFPDLL